MLEAGVRELKIHASQIVRAVKERHTPCLVTLRGRPIAVLLPLEEPPLPTGSAADAWEELTALGEEIGRGWRSEKSSAELLSEMRR